MAHIRFLSSQAILLFLVITLVSTISFSQNTTRDVVYLKNGSIVKGSIIEQIPNKSLKIQTADGSIFVYDYSEVDKIVKEGTIAFQLTDQYQNVPKGQVSLFGGVSIPSGDFASTSGTTPGYAKTGYGFGAQYNYFLPNSIFWSLSLNLAFNPMDESAVRQAIGVPSTVSADISSYSTITPMVGFGFYSSSNPDVIFYGQGQIGILFGSTPDIKFSSGSVSVTQSSASSTAIAYGFQAGVTISGKISLSARYISGKPKYKVTASGGGSSFSSEFEQPTGLFQVFAGIAF